MLVGQQVGPFAVEKEIGAGAMGTVYRASYTKTGEKLAIKVIAPGLGSNPNTLARFERETAILKKLNHRNIVRLYATGRVDGMPFYAMEYVDGDSLEAVLERRGRFSWEEVVTLGRQICAALQHAHEQGIVHRDLKPANVMMTADGTAKLTDFGIAKTLTVEQLTATNCTVGTAAYMSPEQCRGERDLTPKSDLYSLGVLFYELLTGRKPFPAESTLDMFLAHVEGKFERPSRLVMDIPIWLDTLVCQLLEKKPEQRPLDAATVAQALDRVVEKVAAQRSAGVDVVSARGVDLSRHVQRPDETDLEAARTLRAAVSKKRYKRRVKRFYERLWFQAVAIGALLLTIGGVIYWATRPPSADQLFARAQKLMQANNADDQAKAREGPIAQYLKYYADRQGEQAAQVRRWADEVDVATLELQLHNRLKMKLAPEGGAETRAQTAVRAEDAGDLAAAREQWQALESYKTDRNPEQRSWGLLAVRRLRGLQGVDEKEKQLREQVREERATGRDLKPAGDLEKLPLQAERFEEFGDLSTAFGLWQNLKERYQEDGQQRVWYLLAAKKVKELRGREKKGRAEVVRDKLKKAAELAPSKPAEARVVCQDIVALYEKVPDLGAEVEQARKLLGRLPAGSRP